MYFYEFLCTTVLHCVGVVADVNNCKLKGVKTQLQSITNLR